MLFMNSGDIDDAKRRFNSRETPNLATGARALSALADWTNRNSDGWCYWPKPCRAARSLQTLLQSADRFDPTDVSSADLTKALSPIKAFLTRQGVSHDEVLLWTR
jgi:hypothetical protein